jgi:hypothetical protein
MVKRREEGLDMSRQSAVLMSGASKHSAHAHTHKHNAHGTAQLIAAWLAWQLPDAAEHH